jgi:hypothetical protein
MDLERNELQAGDMVKIKDTSYQVIYVQGEAEPAPMLRPPVRSFLGIYIKELNPETEDSNEPTHLLKFYYEDTKECRMLSLKSENILPDEINLEE